MFKSWVLDMREEHLRHLYDRFNARDMESVLAAMHEDVVWANGMECADS
jgi:ketosteroid isomerase-like protein